MPQAKRMHTTEEYDALQRRVTRMEDVMGRFAENDEDLRDLVEESDPSLPGLTRAEVSGMTVEQIIENKAAVDRVMAAGPQGDLPMPTDQPPPSGRLATGQQFLHEHTATPERTALSRESVAKMSHEELTARKAEVDAWLASGGASR